MTKKALIVTPYLDHLGGGERYMLEAASVIESTRYQLYFAWDNLAQITKLTNLLNIKLVNPQLDPDIISLYTQGNPLSMYKATHKYDLILYLSDGSIPLLGGKKNIIHFQIPHHDVGGGKIATQLKLKKINHVIVNSQFTKSVIDKEFHLNSRVIYPPVQPIKAGKKSKLILSVGRFEPTINIKRQDILIEAFAKLSPELPGWRLALAGGSHDKNWLSKLQSLASDLPIDFYPNINYRDLTKLYARASIYWHGAGFGVDQDQNPELVEHFGITTAEAITAMCIPLIVPKGGQPEVIPSPNYHWETLDQLKTLTLKVVSGNLTPVSLPPSIITSSFADMIKRMIKS